MANVGIELTSMSDALKRIYTDRETKLQCYKNNPLLGMIPKRESFAGATFEFPIWHYTDQGVGRTISGAQDNQSDLGIDKFVIDARKTRYAVHQIDNQTMKASRGDSYSFLSGRAAMMKSALHNLGRENALDLYGDGTGSRGVVGSVGGNVVTLLSAADVVNFEVGMQVVFPTAAATGALKTGGGSTVATITKVSRSSATTASFTYTGGPNDIAANDHIVRRGFDYVTGASYKCIMGIGAWVPSSDPGATSFFGVDRSVDTARLGGLRHNGTSQSVSDAILDAGTLAFREGARPDYIFMNPTHVAEVNKELNGKTEYDPVKNSEGVVFWEALKFRTPAGTLGIISDPNCPRGRALMLQMDTWALCSLGPAPHLLDEDGLTLLRVSNDDAYEARWGQYAELGCYAPGNNVYISLAT